MLSLDINILVLSAAGEKTFSRCSKGLPAQHKNYKTSYVKVIKSDMHS